MPIDDIKAQIDALAEKERGQLVQLLVGKLTLEDLGKLLQPSTQEKLPEETIRLAYKEYGDQIRHFSTVRSALTTFLLTVSLAAFSAYFNRNQSHVFLIAAGLIFAAASLLACLTFSFRTEKAVLRYRKVSKYLSRTETLNAKELFSHQPSYGDIWAKMCKDPMNWLLLTGVALIIVSFHGRDHLESLLQSIRF